MYGDVNITIVGYAHPDGFLYSVLISDVADNRQKLCRVFFFQLQKLRYFHIKHSNMISQFQQVLSQIKSNSLVPACNYNMHISFPSDRFVKSRLPQS